MSDYEFKSQVEPDDYAERKFRFKGYDYEELLDCWGLAKRAKKIRKWLSEADEIGVFGDEKLYGFNDVVGQKLIISFINENSSYASEGFFILPQVKEDMVSFLLQLVDSEYCSDAETKVIKCVLDASLEEEDDLFFYSWFVRNLEALWT